MTLSPFVNEPPDSYRRLLEFARRLVPNWQDAEDLVQEAQLRFCQMPDGEVQVPAAWMKIVMTRLAVDQHRSVLRHQHYLTHQTGEVLVEDGDSVSRLTEIRAALAGELSTMVGVLEPWEVGVLLLREAFDWRYREIAKVSGKTEAAARQLQHRAWLRFRAGRHQPSKRQGPQADAQNEATLLACIRAIVARDPAAVVALVSQPVVDATLQAAIVAGRGHTSGSTQTVMTNVMGRYMMLVILDGVVLCALPVGAIDCSSSMACEI